MPVIDVIFHCFASAPIGFMFYPAMLAFLCTMPVQSPEKLTAHTLKVAVGAPAAKADLAEFQFLEGTWAGSGFGADCDEMWGPSAGNCMLGTFRMVEHGELKFTEFFMLQKDSDGGIVLRLKHFHANFDGWEAKDKFIRFPLIKVEKNGAYFGGLTYSLQPNGELKTWVAMKEKDGSFSEAEFQMKRVATRGH